MRFSSSETHERNILLFRDTGAGNVQTYDTTGLVCFQSQSVKGDFLKNVNKKNQSANSFLEMYSKNQGCDQDKTKEINGGILRKKNK